MRILRDKVLIRQDTVPKLSDIIELPDDTEVKPPPVGTVVAVGPDVTEVHAGETVHFESFDWNVAPGDCIVIAEGEILAKEIIT